MKTFRLFIALLFSIPSFSQSDLNRGLLAYYPFTGNAYDASSNGNNGVVFNANLTADRKGKPKSAYHFNGKNAYIQVFNSRSLQPGRQISMCAWVKVTGFYTGSCYNNMIMIKGDEEYEENNFWMRYADPVHGCDELANTKKEQFYSGSDKSAAIAAPHVIPDHWYALVCTYDGANFRLYIDCVLQNTSPVVRGISFNNPYAFIMGKAKFYDHPYFMNGDIDEVRIYNRALNIDEIRAYSDCPVKKIKDSVVMKETELLSFTAVPAPDNKFIHLSWSAKDEYAGSYIIERSIKDSADYKVVKKQPMRQKPGVNKYSFYDYNVIPNIVYDYEIHYLKGDKLRSEKKRSASAELKKN